MTGSEFIKVTARVRPSSSCNAQECIINVIDKKNLCFNPRNPRNFTFDAVFNKDVTQEQVFDEAASHIIDGCVEGFNGTIFAYGQTGSGKTHTMLGPSNVDNVFLNAKHRGLIPRACDALFTKLCTIAAEKGESFKYEVACKFVELYNEELFDLLRNSQQKLTIRSDSKAVQLLGVSEHPVYSSADMMRILETGWEARRTAETAMNRESSRSHAMFIIDIRTEEMVNTLVNKKCATLNLVDLAGSERQAQAKTVGDRFKETVNINLSLTVLGRVIRTLSAAKRRDEHAPYRESKLTHILRDSLGGNSKTAVIVNVHPDVEYCSETLSTLQFAAACRKIENRVHANEDLTGDTVMAYKEEITRLREELKVIEANIRSEMTAKLTSVEYELKNWKETAISREKDLAEARLRCNLLSVQMTCESSGVEDMKSHNEAMRAVSSQLSRRIESIRTFEDLSRAQLENNLSNAYSELEQMRLRYENAEASREAILSKYNGFLQGCNETLSELSFRRLTLNTARKSEDVCKTPAQQKKERRRTIYTPATNQSGKIRGALEPVLSEGAEEFDALNNGDVMEDVELAEEYETLRLEMENNRLSQIVSEKESAIKSIYESQKHQADQWAKEKQELLKADSLLKLRIEHLESENNTLHEQVKKYRKKAELLGATISSFNDERCRLHQQIDELHSEKLDLEDRLQAIRNEQELIPNKTKDVTNAQLLIVNPDTEVELARQCFKKLQCNASEKRTVQRDSHPRKGKCNGFDSKPHSSRHFATYRSTIEDSFDNKLNELRSTFLAEKRTTELSANDEPCKEREAIKKQSSRLPDGCQHPPSTKQSNGCDHDDSKRTKKRAKPRAVKPGDDCCSTVLKENQNHEKELS